MQRSGGKWCCRGTSQLLPSSCWPQDRPAQPHDRRSARPSEPNSCKLSEPNSCQVQDRQNPTPANCQNLTLAKCKTVSLACLALDHFAHATHAVLYTDHFVHRPFRAPRRGYPQTGRNAAAGQWANPRTASQDQSRPTKTNQG
eukprot:355835-Chlamydomonas_euryale.AAC.2